MDVYQSFIDNSEEFIIGLQTRLTAAQAMAPENGGTGEYTKVNILKNILTGLSFDDFEEIQAPDDRVPCSFRPSLLVTVKGRNHEKSLWIISHLDVVPPGDKELWDTDPFKAVVKDGKIYGRGTEDNQQGIVASIVAAKALLHNKITPEIDIKLLFVADEEVGSKYGIEWILNNRSDLFKKDDLILIPDAGDPDGEYIEIGEKSILWLEFNIQGKQAHGSRPDLGVNAARASSKLTVELDKLYEIFSHKNEQFDVPYSTFEPTKRVCSVSNINTIPGSEILCYDCRVLPIYKLDDVLAQIDKAVEKVRQETKTEITYTIKQRVDAPLETSPQASIVLQLTSAIEKKLGFKPKTYGIGGGTVAAYFRQKGYAAALWTTLDGTMHSPNEYSSISNTQKDAAVFAELMSKAT